MNSSPAVAVPLASTAEPLRVLDLFSGIGGFSLGLERTGGFSLGLERTGGFKTVAFCEIEEYPRRVLAKHWPDVPIFEDVRTLKGSDVGAVDVICGGPPCQPNSSASRGRSGGAEDPRFLWWEACRLVHEARPAWFVFENVVNFDSVGLEPVVSRLAESGYEIITPLEIPACAVGLDHRRPRIWLCGYSHGNRKPRLPVDAEMARMPGHRPDAGSAGEAHGLSRGMDAYRRSALGNAVVPQIAAAIGRAILWAEGR